MGKENKENKSPAKENKEEVKPKEDAKSAVETGAEESPGALLAKIRPQKRSIFFILWLMAVAWIAFIYDACKVPGKDRKDCGYPDISPSECRSIACFLKGGGSALAKKNVKVKRAEGVTLGMNVDKAESNAVVTKIDTGAVRDHNEAQASDSDDVIRVGDKIMKIDGKAVDGIGKVLKATGAKTVTVEVLRPKLPSYLMWISSGQTTQPNWVEKVLTANGFKQWSTAFSYFSGAGMVCWLLSGYPAASVPIYYVGLSGLLAFGTLRCCHDDGVAGGIPHCYKPRYTKFDEILPKIKEETVKYISKIQKDPQGWFKKTFMT